MNTLSAKIYNSGIEGMQFTQPTEELTFVEIIDNVVEYVDSANFTEEFKYPTLGISESETNWFQESTPYTFAKGTISQQTGYMIEPDGWKVQWGYGSNPTFPIAFEEIPVYVSRGATNVSQVGMTISSGYWQAMGY